MDIEDYLALGIKVIGIHPVAHLPESGGASGAKEAVLSAKLWPDPLS